MKRPTNAVQASAVLRFCFISQALGPRCLTANVKSRLPPVFRIENPPWVSSFSFVTSLHAQRQSREGHSPLGLPVPCIGHHPSAAAVKHPPESPAPACRQIRHPADPCRTKPLARSIALVRRPVQIGSPLPARHAW